MNDRVRRRRSVWDVRDDVQPSAEFGDKNDWTIKERHSGFSNDVSPKRLDAPNVADAQDYSGWSSRELLKENNCVNKDDTIYRDRQQISETMKGWDGDSKHHKSISPAFDEWDQRRQSPHRGRSMIRSRSRSGGRVRSRSRSTSRGRQRNRSWSRSPPHDHRRESYGLGDRRRTSFGTTSQPCRDFPFGRCRRGSQCRFLHQSNSNYRDKGHPENSLTEGWRSRYEHGNAPNDSNNRGPQDDMSDGYGDGYARVEPHKSSGKGKICCKDFLKGKCRWGASCRFSHDDTSNDTHARGSRNASMDQERQYQANSNGKSICKYFMMGKCFRDDCRFSHDSKSGQPESRSSDDRWDHNTDDKNMSWNSPLLEESARVSVLSGIKKSSGWDDNSVLDRTFSDSLAPEKQNASENWRRTWSASNQSDKAAEGQESLDCGNRCVDSINAEGRENLVSKEELQLNSLGQRPQLQTWDTHVHETNSTYQVASVLQPKSLETPFYQQLPGGGNISGVNYHKLTIKLESPGNTLHVPAPVEGLNTKFDHIGSGSILGASESSLTQDVLTAYPSNGRTIGLNGNLLHIQPPPSLGKKIDFNDAEAVETHAMLELEVPPLSLPISENIVTGEKLGQLASQRFGNDLQIHPHNAGLGGVNHTLLLPHPNSGPLISPADSIVLEANHATGSQVQYERIGDITQPTNLSNYNQPTVLFPSSSEHTRQMPLGQLVSSLVNYASGNNQVNDTQKDDAVTNPELKQPEPVTDVESSKNNDMLAEKSMQKGEKLLSENVEVEPKVDEGLNNKDEKGMRLFRIALVEFVKECLKPTWKEGKMSREVHKTIVKKVVDKVTGTIQGDHVPKTQDKIDQYIAFSKAKITKLVQAYVERLLKN